MEDVKMQIICILFVIVIILLLEPILRRIKYRKSDYYKKTKNTYKQVMREKGLYGEYLLSIYLNKLEGKKRILYNVYLEKEGGGTTEVDMILLHESGIYVIESKNYSGIITGKEEDRYWKQTLKNGETYSFYNPIRQNETHIRNLSRILGMTQEEKYYSIVVFGDQAVLKKIKIDGMHVFVIKREKLIRLLRCLALVEKRYSKDQIETMYERLIVFCNPSEEIKQKHRDSIHKLYG